MLNYYELLGISQSADEKLIKTTFKRLALKYHPDRNPGNLAAEEYFKQINEAYQILSNPDKRRRYDFILNYSIQSTNTTTPKPHYNYYQQKKERSVYDRYGRFNWRTAPKYKPAPSYKIDKNYFKLQAFTLGFMALLSCLIWSTRTYWSYIKEQEQLEVKVQNEKALHQAQSLYETGQYREALDLVILLDRQNPIESIFYEEREKMVSGILQSATINFNTKLFQKAATQLEIVKDYERPMKMKTWEMLADCYTQLEDYRNAVPILDRMLERDKYNIGLAVKLARLNHKYLNNEEKALAYYDEAKLLFKEFQSSAYGDAFELVMEPSRLPDFYHELFLERAHLNIKVGNFEEALTDCNWAIFLRPQVGNTYNMRGHCKRELGLLARACIDWQRAIAHGHSASKVDLNKYCQ